MISIVSLCLNLLAMAKFRREVNQAGKHNTRSRTEDQQPPSPPLSDEHSGLYQLQQHNATMQSQQDPLAYGHATYNQLQPNTTYNSPEQLQAVIESYRADPYQAALHDQQRDPREGLTYVADTLPTNTYKLLVF